MKINKISEMIFLFLIPRLMHPIFIFLLIKAVQKADVWGCVTYCILIFFNHIHYHFVDKIRYEKDRAEIWDQLSKMFDIDKNIVKILNTKEDKK